MSKIIISFAFVLVLLSYQLNANIKNPKSDPCTPPCCERDVNTGQEKYYCQPNQPIECTVNCYVYCEGPQYDNDADDFLEGHHHCAVYSQHTSGCTRVRGNNPHIDGCYNIDLKKCSGEFPFGMSCDIQPACHNALDLFNCEVYEEKTPLENW